MAIHLREVVAFESYFLWGFSDAHPSFVVVVLKFYQIGLIVLDPNSFAMLSVLPRMIEWWLGTEPRLSL